MKHIAVALGIFLAGMLMGCSNGSSTSSSSTVSISISPTSASVSIGHTQQFTATVANTSNTGVTWEVNGIVGGNASIGTISSSGLYTAPGNATSVSVTAVSATDATKSASASVSVALPITISPSTAAVSLSGTVQFTSVVSLSSNTAVTWQVNGTAGGNSTNGTISTSGLYTAPATLPNPNIVTITAVAQADTTQSASASITINPPPLVIAPTGVTLAAGLQQTFSATVNGASVTPTWSVACRNQSSGACGSITSGGVLTAPSSPPPGGTVTITATMPGGSAVPASTTVAVQFSNASLVGSFAFAFAIQSGQLLSAEAGTITFDGNGSVTSGVADRSDHSGTPVSITGGTYQVGSDGRGTAVLQTAAGPVAWQFVITNQSQGFVVRFDANGDTASGTLELQHPDQFGLAAINGNYAMILAGISGASPSTVMAMIGSLTADGLGNVSRGILDINDGTSTATNVGASGSYTAPSPAGRGTFTVSSAIGIQTFAYYQVDSAHLKLVEVDGDRALAGDLFRQPSGPFTTASFHGRFAFTLGGSKAGSVFGMGGIFTLDGSGGITSRVLDGVNQTVFDSQGGYFLTDSSSGRTSLTWTVNNGTALQYVLYPRNDGGFVMLEVDGSAVVAAGVVLPQTLSTPNVFSLEGNFAVSLIGAELPSRSTNESITGQVALPGGSAFSGVLDINDKGATTVGGSFQTGVFLVDVNSGRGVAAALPSSSVLSDASLIFYIVDADKALVLENDNTRILTGVTARQY